MVVEASESLMTIGPSVTLVVSWGVSSTVPIPPIVNDIILVVSIVDIALTVALIVAIIYAVPVTVEFT